MRELSWQSAQLVDKRRQPRHQRRRASTLQTAFWLSAKAMLSDAAKAEIIGVLAGCFVASVAFLICLLCPCCPVRAALSACAEKGRSGHKKPLRRGSGETDHMCCLSCCNFDEAASTHSSTYGGLQADADPASAALARHPKVWGQKRLATEPAPRVSLTFSVSRQPDCLAVHLYSAEGTPGPRLGLCHNNFAQVQVLPDEASAVPSSPSEAVDAVRTCVIGQTASPVFNETLVLPLAAGEADDAQRLLVRCLDYDRFSRERIVGEVRVPLPPQVDLTVQYNGLAMEPAQVEAGELLVALHYMPTAERLGVILLKASDVYTADGQTPATYLHLVLLANGSVVFKKRTRIFDETARPVYNEAVSIDLPRRRLDRVSLIVSVMSCHARQRVRPDLDACLGYVVFSSSCYGSGRAHWVEMVSRPRTPLAYWHRLT